MGGVPGRWSVLPTTYMPVPAIRFPRSCGGLSVGTWPAMGQTSTGRRPAGARPRGERPSRRSRRPGRAPCRLPGRRRAGPDGGLHPAPCPDQVQAARRLAERLGELRLHARPVAVAALREMVVPSDGGAIDGDQSIVSMAACRRVAVSAPGSSSIGPRVATAPPASASRAWTAGPTASATSTAPRASCIPPRRPRSAAGCRRRPVRGLGLSGHAAPLVGGPQRLAASSRARCGLTTYLGSRADWKPAL
jgi:hypothetical protein